MGRRGAALKSLIFLEGKFQGIRFSRASALMPLNVHCGGADLKLEDKQAFLTDIATTHGRRLRRYLAARLRNAADASDLAQEVFLRLMRVEHHESIRNPEAYVMT